MNWFRGFPSSRLPWFSGNDQWRHYALAVIDFSGRRFVAEHYANKKTPPRERRRFRRAMTA
jgi:hypothetical protein